MSRIGKNPAVIPEGVTVTLEPTRFSAKGKLGELAMPLTSNVTVKQEENKIVVTPNTKEKTARMMWGTTKRLIENMMTGVSQGFTKQLEVNGVGFKVALKGKELVMNLGFSHEIRYAIPDDVKVECPKPTEIKVSGADKQRVGKVASDIREFKKPEPYKGKGIRYSDEYVRRKEGKKK